MLSARKDECNRNIRDLGVLPEEAFKKYTNEKLDRVSHPMPMTRGGPLIAFTTVGQEVAYSQRRLEEVCSREQEGF